MIAEKWFLKELQMIDSRYFVVWNEMYGYWEIKVRLDCDRKTETVSKEEMDVPGVIKNAQEAMRVFAKNPTIAVELRLDDAALNDLRRRKYLRTKYVHNEDEIRDIAYRNKQAEEKASRLGIELIADGLIKLDKIENQRSQTYDMAPAMGGAS